MNKKIYIGIGIVIVALLVVGELYLQSQRTAVSSIESETSFEEQALEQDLAELEEFEQDKSLENLEQDLSEIAEETEEGTSTASKKVDITGIENLENELDTELSSLSADLSDLENGFINDTSLNDLDSGLAGIIE